MIKVWGRASSSNVQAVMWALTELGQTAERKDIGHNYGGNDTPEFLAMNPNGTIPVIQIDDNEPVWETGAILRYIAALYGNDEFWPADPHKRSQIDKWAEWAKINAATKFTVPVFWRVARTAPSKQDPVAIKEALTTFENLLRLAEQQLSKHAFLAGPNLTIADVQLGHVLYRYFDIDIDRANLPIIAQYYANLVARPAYRDHVMVSYEELCVRD